MQGQRKDLTGQVNPVLHEGEYGLLGGIWWVYRPDGQITAVDGVTEHEDGTITAEFEQLGKTYRIDHGIWKSPAQR